MFTLIIGGDSKLSYALISVLNKKHIQFFRTTRRNIISEDQIFLDLNNVSNFKIPPNVNAAVIVGGVTSYDACTKQYDYAYHVNCESIPQLVRMFLRKNIYTCFISSNTVFKFLKGLPQEYDKPCPGFEYANLKAETEKKLIQISEQLNKQELFSILRLTKNVSLDTPPFGKWIDQIYHKEKISAFSDLYFAPIRFSDSAKAIQIILKSKKSGIFHLSGEKDISYSDFAIKLLNYLQIDNDIVSPVKSTDIGVNLAYNHPITALDMNMTTSLFELKPITLIDIFKYLGTALENKILRC
ncbi:MAG: sugar nucleotide-binding protein [Pseudomonadota bacterium]